MTIYFLANDFRGRVNYVVVEVLTIIHYYRMLAVPPLIHLTTKQENINLLSRTTREDISRCDDEVVKLFTTSKVAAKREGFGSTHSCLRCPPNDDDVSEIGSRPGWCKQLNN